MPLEGLGRVEENGKGDLFRTVLTPLCHLRRVLEETNQGHCGGGGGDGDQHRNNVRASHENTISLVKQATGAVQMAT